MGTMVDLTDTVLLIGRVVAVFRARRLVAWNSELMPRRVRAALLSPPCIAAARLIGGLMVLVALLHILSFFEALDSDRSVSL